MNYEGYETGGQTPCTKRIGLKAAREREREREEQESVLSLRNNIGSAAEDSLSPRLRNVNVTIQTRAKRVTYSEFITESGWINWGNHYGNHYALEHMSERVDNMYFAKLPRSGHSSSCSVLR